MAEYLQIRRVLLIAVALITEVFGNIQYHSIWNLCGERIQLGHDMFAGEIVFFPGFAWMSTCEVTIDNLPGYDISLKYGSDIQTGICDYNLRIHNSYVNYTNNWPSFQTGNDITAESNNITISFEAPGCTDNDFYFKLIYSSFRDAGSHSCYNNEVYCLFGRCIDRSIACLQYYRFCSDQHAGCSDIVRDTPVNDAQVIPLVVVPIVVAVVLYIILSKMCGLHAKIKKCLGCEDPARRGTPPLAVDVFTVTTSADGDESDSEAGPIDYTTYRDPPPYDSLEHLDRVAKTPEDDVDGKMEPPPDYSSVMMNQIQFKVSHMDEPPPTPVISPLLSLTINNPSDVLDMPVDPNEPTYCLCHQVSYGEMIGCDNLDCPIEWFHFGCVGLTAKPKGKWYCPRCTEERKKK